MACTWLARGLHVACTSFAPGFHLASTRLSSGLHQASTWLALHLHLADVSQVRVQPFERRFEARKPAHLAKQLTLLDALEVEDDTAFNALLNSASPESVLLLDSYADVKRVVFDSQENLQAATPDGARHFKRGAISGTEPAQGAARGLLAQARTNCELSMGRALGDGVRGSNQPSWSLSFKLSARASWEYMGGQRW